MIHESHGDLLDSAVGALVNTVNTVGVMGKGIALQFRRRFPDMFRAYERAAKRRDPLCQDLAWRSRHGHQHSATRDDAVMTVTKAAFIATIRQYSEIALDVSLIEVQKLMHFLQVAGEDMRLDYTKGRYGPYADNLRKALRSMEGHFITGFGDGSKPVQEAEPIELLPGASDAADRLLDTAPDTVARVE